MRDAHASGGFTLFELVAILTLLGVVSVTALGRLSNGNAFSAAAHAQELRSALRFAQKFAVASGCDVQAVVDGGSDSYALWLRADASGAAGSCLTASGAFGVNPLRNPQTGGAFAGSAPSGVDVSGSFTVQFDAAGRSASGGSVTVGTDTVSVLTPSGLVQ